MEIDRAFCPTCNREVRITWTPMPSHEGHANLPEGHELVCLDLGERCCGGKCPVSELPETVMAVRLAKSGLREEGWPITHLKCQGCDQVTEMQVLDDSTALCTVCGSTNHWVLLDLMPQGLMAVPASR